MGPQRQGREDRARPGVAASILYVGSAMVVGRERAEQDVDGEGLH